MPLTNLPTLLLPLFFNSDSESTLAFSVSLFWRTGTKKERREAVRIFTRPPRTRRTLLASGFFQAPAIPISAGCVYRCLQPPSPFSSLPLVLRSSPRFFVSNTLSLSCFCPTIGNLTSRIDDLNIHGIIFYISFIFPKKIMVFFGGSLAYRCFAYFESKSFLFILVAELFPKSCLLNLIPENWEQDTIAN